MAPPPSVPVPLSPPVPGGVGAVVPGVEDVPGFDGALGPGVRWSAPPPVGAGAGGVVGVRVGSVAPPSGRVASGSRPSSRGRSSSPVAGRSVVGAGSGRVGRSALRETLLPNVVPLLSSPHTLDTGPPAAHSMPVISAMASRNTPSAATARRLPPRHRVPCVLASVNSSAVAPDTSPATSGRRSRRVVWSTWRSAQVRSASAPVRASGDPVPDTRGNYTGRACAVNHAFAPGRSWLTGADLAQARRAAEAAPRVAAGAPGAVGAAPEPAGAGPLPRRDAEPAGPPAEGTHADGTPAEGGSADGATGVAAYCSLHDIEEPVDLAVIAVPAEAGARRHRRLR